MKIRTDFVTNSSSSSYILRIILNTCDGNQYRYKLDPTDEDSGDGMKVSIDEKVLNKVKKAGTVEELCDKLTSSIAIDQYSDFYDLLDYDPKNDTVKELAKIIRNEGLEDDNPLITEAEENIEKFKSDVKNGVKEIGDISDINVYIEHNAYGDFSSGGDIIILGHDFNDYEGDFDDEDGELEFVSLTLDMKSKKIIKKTFPSNSADDEFDPSDDELRF